MSADDSDERIAETARQIAELATSRDVTLAVAESLTGGEIACRLGAAPSSSTWFRGGVVAYSPQVKYAVLGAPPGPVVTPQTAAAMARGVAHLMDADVTLAVTGVGGPDEEEGHPPGTVWFGVLADGEVLTDLQHFRGEPDEVLRATTAHALRLLLDSVR